MSQTRQNSTLYLDFLVFFATISHTYNTTYRGIRKNVTNWQHLTWTAFKNALYQTESDDKLPECEDRGFRQKSGKLFTQITKKRALHGLYIKRRVCDNYVNTEPHNDL